jgi:hypothetical protein
MGTIFGLLTHDTCREVFAAPPLGSWCLHYFKPSGGATKKPDCSCCSPVGCFFSFKCVCLPNYSSVSLDENN